MRAARTAAAIVDRDLVEDEAAVHDHPDAGPAAHIASVPPEHQRMMDASAYLAARLHEVPVLVIPCIEGRTDGVPFLQQAVTWGSILPATWSFMLAARARGLGTAWTSLHLAYEREAAAVLGIPYGRVMQVALIPVAHTIGTEFKPGPRARQQGVHWDHW